ncbi:SH3 domain-containing protein [Enterovirga rhinocerotis]|uniref:SH3 domain-containing protein n=1 Tax=Enterovirga rhinocerotis TaxID=1339210 RepID=A0A4R7BQP9_9HYPH|nr:SH3 domain-containing protein [Enterovirga rhinocerotis]TDR87072.1 SH3 domain-containing protein [Enterovirga rhinocerotis]
MIHRALLGALSGAALLLAAGAASAQTFCYVSDPTGTPLNIRIEPNGRVVGVIANGTQVTISESRRDERGRLWVFVRNLDTNQGIGWVYRNFLNC